MSEFTKAWFQAWNDHDLDEIMEHYSEDIDFVSPIVRHLGIDPKGRISNRTMLRDYFSKALQTYPDLHFDFHYEMKGEVSMVLCYGSINGALSAEYMERDPNGKVTKVRAHYTDH